MASHVCRLRAVRNKFSCRTPLLGWYDASACPFHSAFESRKLFPVKEKNTSQESGNTTMRATIRMKVFRKQRPKCLIRRARRYPRIPRALNLDGCRAQKAAPHINRALLTGLGDHHALRSISPNPLIQCIQMDPIKTTTEPGTCDATYCHLKSSPH